MSKSPLNFGFGAIAAGVIGARGRKKLGRRVSQLEKDVAALQSETEPADPTGAEQTGDPIITVGSEIQDAQASLSGPAEDVLSAPGMNPAASDVATKMFGTEIPGSFDKNMNI